MSKWESIDEIEGRLIRWKGRLNARDGDSLSDFGSQSGGSDYGGLEVTDVDVVDDVCGAVTRPA
jgi:hypothetical protein